MGIIKNFLTNYSSFALIPPSGTEVKSGLVDIRLASLVKTYLSELGFDDVLVGKPPNNNNTGTFVAVLPNQTISFMRQTNPDLGVYVVYCGSKNLKKDLLYKFDLSPYTTQTVSEYLNNK